MDKKRYSSKEMDDWGGVTTYRLLQSHLNRTAASSEDLSSYGARLHPLMRKRLQDEWSSKPDVVKDLMGKVREAIRSMTAEELRTWVLSQLRELDWETEAQKLWISLHISKRRGLTLDVWEEVYLQVQPAVRAAHLSLAAERHLSSLPRGAWESLLGGLQEMSKTQDLPDDVTEVLPLEEASQHAAFHLDGVTKGIVLKHEDFVARTMTQPNEAVVLLREMKERWGGDAETAYRLLWEQGVTGGAKKGIEWDQVARRGGETPVDEGVQEAMCRVIEAVEDYTGRESLIVILELGREGKLIPTLKKATYHDRLDEKRYRNAAKRAGDGKTRTVSDLRSGLIGGDGIGDEEVLDKGTDPEPDPGYEQVEKDLLIEQIEAQARAARDLTDREREVVLLRICCARDEGKCLTYEELAQLPQIEVETDFPRVFSGTPSG